MLNNYFKSAVLAAFLFYSLQLSAAVISFSGNLALVEDAGGAIYSGSGVGANFSGFIDDVTFNGSISNGSITTPFSCCIAAGGLSISNDEILDLDTAMAINELLGTPTYSAGNIVDIVDIEGDIEVPGGGRLEVGVSYIFNSAVFPDENPGNYPFILSDVELAAFFILEEDAAGAEIYGALGRFTPVPVPAAFWLFGSAIFALVGFRLSPVPREC